MAATAKPPTAAQLKKALGPAAGLWAGVVRSVGAAAPLDVQWRPSKLAFGRTCLLRSGDRTLLYLIPGDGGFLAAIVLGERAYRLAVAAAIPAAVKRMLAGARPYAEGRGIRLPVRSPGDVVTVAELVRIKLVPKP